MNLINSGGVRHPATHLRPFSGEWLTTTGRRSSESAHHHHHHPLPNSGVEDERQSTSGALSESERGQCPVEITTSMVTFSIKGTASPSKEAFAVDGQESPSDLRLARTSESSAGSSSSAGGFHDWFGVAASEKLFELGVVTRRGVRKCTSLVNGNTGKQRFYVCRCSLITYSG